MVFEQPLFQDTPKLLPEGSILLLIVRRQIGEQTQHLLARIGANGINHPILLEKFA